MDVAQIMDKVIFPLVVLIMGGLVLWGFQVLKNKADKKDVEKLEADLTHDVETSESRLNKRIDGVEERNTEAHKGIIKRFVEDVKEIKDGQKELNKYLLEIRNKSK